MSAFPLVDELLAKGIVPVTREVRQYYDMTFSSMSPVQRALAMMRILRNQAGPWRGPSNLLVAVTDRCQCSCRHCGVHGTGAKGGDLPLETIRSILSQFRALGGVKFFIFGGEPLLRDDVVEIASAATDLGLSSVLNTNGIRMTPALAADLKKAGLCTAEFSLDSTDPKKFGELRGYPGILQHVVDAIHCCQDAGLVVGVITYAYRENLSGGLRDIIEMCRKEGIRGVRILEPITAGRWASATEQALHPDEMELLEQHLEPGFVYGESQGRDAGVCSAVRGDMVHVCADGTVQACAYVPHPLGNVLETPLADIVLRLEELRDYGHEHPGCPVNDPAFRKRFGPFTEGE